MEKEKRKLSKGEEKRKKLYEEKKKELIEQGYEEKDLTISVDMQILWRLYWGYL